MVTWLTPLPHLSSSRGVVYEWTHMYENGTFTIRHFSIGPITVHRFLIQFFSYWLFTRFSVKVDFYAGQYPYGQCHLYYGPILYRDLFFLNSIQNLTLKPLLTSILQSENKIIKPSFFRLKLKWKEIEKLKTELYKRKMKWKICNVAWTKKKYLHI